ncbi:MAG: 4-alpha-glucanotransferase [Tannerella sp.]|jgi:4-alpha-glucanotransferase|nr:4-alpha-glucanotransferase [Tannerella sp.]
MKITFNIHYLAGTGQKICIVGAIDELGAWQTVLAKEMNDCGNGQWILDVEIPFFVKTLDYRYVLKLPDGTTIFEPCNKTHSTQFSPKQARYYLFDYWLAMPENPVLYTSAFIRTIFAHASQAYPAKEEDGEIIIRVSNPHVGKDQHVAIAGNQDVLGMWQPEDAKEMICTHFPEWEIRLGFDGITFPVEYKFLIRDTKKQTCLWETGDNRILPPLPQHEKAACVVSEYPYRDNRMPWKGAGVVIPVFSLRSARSFGIGDLYDLKLLVDWAVLAGLHLIQILPVNDTTRTHTWEDSYPYSAISIYALHPVYISLQEMGAPKDEKKAAFYARKQQALNRENAVDYEEVEKYKMQYCRDFFEQEGAQILKSPAFKSFLKANRSWLIPYAAFCFFREKYHTSDFTQWGEDARCNLPRIQSLCKESSSIYSDISYTYFLQFVLHTQFKSVSDYARKKGVILKGDLPIGIHRTSVDAWLEPPLFNHEGQAGAPPDDFSETGQNWSFPTYNWDVMEKNDFLWWKKRFAKLGDYFNCIRIDHILGFFRIWEVPNDFVQGLCGHFRPALPLTVREIESFGLEWDERLLKPRIHRRCLDELFGVDARKHLDTFLIEEDSAHLTLKPVYDTQRKIEGALGKHADALSVEIKNGLFAIAHEVLFLKDPYAQAKFHPRISGNRSFAYAELSPKAQTAFDRLSHHFFYERHNAFWKAEALKRLIPIIESTDMLICGEDLGMIPASVHEVMTQLHILSLELERTPKILGEQFACLSKLPYLSVCTTSTHDMSPLRLWWKENPEKRQQYYQSVLRRNGTAPASCSAKIAAQILGNHLGASSILAVIPLQDWLAMSDALKYPRAEDERINIPADPNHYWRYRMHLTLEKLIESDEFNRKIRNMLAEYGRL